MINDETIYWQAGFKAGTAARKHDAGMVNLQKSWFIRAKSVEKGADKQVAEKAYNRGYAEAARVDIAKY